MVASPLSDTDADTRAVSDKTLLAWQADPTTWPTSKRHTEGFAIVRDLVSVLQADVPGMPNPGC